MELHLAAPKCVSRNPGVFADLGSKDVSKRVIARLTDSTNEITVSQKLGRSNIMFLTHVHIFGVISHITMTHET